MPSGSSFTAALLSPGPAPDRAEKLTLYGRLIGDWVMDARVDLPGGGRHEGQGEIHFAWALEGRAVQDVWILPGIFYGTTLRIYDPGIDAWHILWNDPVRQYYARQIGRAEGENIVQDGTNAAGEQIRWSFVDLRPDSFRWLGEISSDGGKSWRLQSEFLARRAAT